MLKFDFYRVQFPPAQCAWLNIHAGKYVRKGTKNAGTFLALWSMKYPIAKKLK